MGKKIRFPLNLAGNTRVHNLEELRENFDLESVLGHYKSGKLLTWLEDRYLEGEAEAVRSLDESAEDFQRRLCEALHVEYTGGNADMEAVRLRQERLARLRTIADEQEFIDHIDQVVFNQEELADLLDEDTAEIYLCGEKFTVPASRRGVTYVGIGNPTVHISGKLPENLDGLWSQFRDCNIDNIPATHVLSEKNVRGGCPALEPEEYENLLLREFLRLNTREDVESGLRNVKVPKTTADGSHWDLTDRTRMVWTFTKRGDPDVEIDISIMDVQIAMEERMFQDE